MNLNERIRNHSLIFYGSKEELLHILDKYSARISKYAFAYHDCDVWDSDCKDSVSGEYKHRKGDIKQPHFHVVVVFYNACTVKASSKLFKTETDNAFAECVGDMQLCYEYLWHKNDSDKFQYQKIIVQSNDINWFEKICVEGVKPDSDNKAEQIVMDLIKGVSFRILLSRYGRDFVIHLSQYEECANRIKSQDLFARMESERLDAERRSHLEELSKPVQQEFNFDKKVGE